jgi:hypothetical protein
VLHLKLGVAIFRTPIGTRVLTPGCSISGFPWRAAVPALHVPILRCRIKASGVVPSQPATSLWPVLPTDRRHWQLRTCDSRADEISSFRPLLLGSHDAIIMHVHGTSVSEDSSVCYVTCPRKFFTRRLAAGNSRYLAQTSSTAASRMRATSTPAKYHSGWARRFDTPPPPPLRYHVGALWRSCGGYEWFVRDTRRGLRC